MTDAVFGQEGSSTVELSPPNSFSYTAWRMTLLETLPPKTKTVCSGKYLEKISEIPRGGEKTNLRYQKVGDSVAEVQAYDD